MATAAGVRSSIINQAANAGLGANETLRQLSDAGLGMRRQSFLKAYAIVVAGLSAKSEAARADLASYPEASHIGAWDANLKANYSYNVEVLIRRTGESEVEPMHVGVNSDSLITYGQALESALDTAVAQGDAYGFAIVAGIVSSVWTSI